MKKVNLIILSLIAASITFSGCSKNKKNPDENAEDLSGQSSLANGDGTLTEAQLKEKAGTLASSIKRLMFTGTSGKKAKLELQIADVTAEAIATPVKIIELSGSFSKTGANLTRSEDKVEKIAAQLTCENTDCSKMKILIKRTDGLLKGEVTVGLVRSVINVLEPEYDDGITETIYDDRYLSLRKSLEENPHFGTLQLSKIQDDERIFFGMELRYDNVNQTKGTSTYFTAKSTLISGIVKEKSELIIVQAMSKPAKKLAKQAVRFEANVSLENDNQDIILDLSNAVLTHFDGITQIKASTAPTPEKTAEEIEEENKAAEEEKKAQKTLEELAEE